MSSALGLLVPLRHMPGLWPCPPRASPIFGRLGVRMPGLMRHGSLGLTLSVGSAMELAKKMDTYGYA